MARWGPITAAVDGPGDQFWRGTIDGVTDIMNNVRSKAHQESEVSE